MQRRFGMSFLVGVLMLALVNQPQGRAVYAAPTAPIFEDIGANLTAVQDSAAAWGDYDRDGDLDLIVAGHTGAAYQSSVYRNNGDSTFTNINAGLIGVRHGAAAWGDYNNDDRLDLLLAGYSASGPVTYLYRNEGGGTFTRATKVELPGINRGSIGWGDYDNDGRLDILLAGESSTGAITRIYHNNGNGTFSDSGFILTEVSNGTALWGDYNNDGWLDVFVTGESQAGNPTSKIYRNTGSSFVDVNAALQSARDSTAAWGDYDNDGDLDVILAGYNVVTPIAKVYRNDAGFFTDINAALVTGDTFTARAAWGDYDGDGRLDILLCSQTETKVFHNDSNDLFTDVQAGLPLVASGAFAWGDYNNDRRLDIILTGRAGSALQTRVFRNILPTANTPPNAPGGPMANVAGRSVTLSWGAASDAETAATGLTYNLQIGTTATGGQLISPMSLDTGVRLIPAHGNRYHTRSVFLSNLAPGQYYWSVQAVDTGFVGSSFSVTDTFRVWAHHVDLPLLLKGNPIFNSPTEIEPNNTPEQANGGLISGQVYTGLHNDAKDYFSFYATRPGTIQASLTTPYQTQLQLQLRSPAISGTNFLAYAYQQPFVATYAITQAGWYYAYIFIEQGAQNNSPYSLTVTYP